MCKLTSVVSCVFCNLFLCSVLCLFVRLTPCTGFAFLCMPSFVVKLIIIIIITLYWMTFNLTEISLLYWMTSNLLIHDFLPS